MDVGFAMFWMNYPKKVDKQKATKAWNKLKPAGQLLADMMAGLERQKATGDWQKDNGKYIPYPAKWLNDRRWEDEVQAQPSANVVVKQQVGSTRSRMGLTERFDESMGWVAAGRLASRASNHRFALFRNHRSSSAGCLN